MLAMKMGQAPAESYTKCMKDNQAVRYGKFANTSDKCYRYTQQKGIGPLQKSLSCELQYSYLSVTCFNQWVVTLVADKLKRTWFLEVYFGIRD